MAPLVRRLVPLLVVAAVLFYGMHRIAERWLVEGIHESVAVADDSRASQRVRDLGKLDAAAIDALVAAAASPRASVALTAQDEIDEMVDRWVRQQHRDPQKFDLGQGPTAMASALASRVADFAQVSHPWLQRVTVTLLDLANGSHGRSEISLYGDCEHVLDSLRQSPTPDGRKVAVRWPAQPAVPEPVVSDAQVPSREWTPAPRQPPSVAANPPAANVIDPTPIDIPIVQSPVAPESVEQPSNGPPARMPLIASSERLPPLQPSISDAEAPTASDVELLRQLAGEDQDLSRVAAAELMKRGFGRAAPRHAQMLLSNSVDDRVALVNVVSTSRNLAAGPWLRILVTDGAGEVRAAAVGAMVVAGDAELRELAWETALNDPDPRVAAWVEQLNNRR